MKGRQLHYLTDHPGAGPTHELAAFPAGLLIKGNPSWSVHAPDRSEEAPGCHFFYFRAEGALVLVTCGKFPFQR
ncbi:MAG: hypothetical protein A2521_02120 [Deltaproteobacteria bacterium RIFOXYD12_FULL_57_12]|nr:MAG: hypothetical protein A2521_02120 [Deltaproteobacteria bacterium RIFOXYD12_FULL_57_12]